MGDAPCDRGATAASASAEGSHALLGAHGLEDNGRAGSQAESGGRGSWKKTGGSTDAREVHRTGANPNALHPRRKQAGRGPVYAG